MNILIIIFFLCSLLVIHTYILYPVSIKFLTIFYHKNYKIDSASTPPISILISAYNEAKVIEKTILKLIASDYPPDKLEILIGSDNSTDQTNNILKELSENYTNVKHISFDTRRGKKFVINDLVKFANGEILFFCDANTLYKKDAIKLMVKYYADAKIGGVCGRLKLTERLNTTEFGNQEKKYWDFESWLKNLEGKIGVLIGANGGIYSIRKSLFVPMPEQAPVIDDFYLSLKILEAGYDFVYCRDSEAYETISPEVRSEFQRKVRIMSRNLETIKKVKSLIFSKSILITYALWSHKILRWFSPIFFILILIINLFTYQLHHLFFLTLIVQLIFYFSAVLGYFLNKLKIKFLPFMLTYYFCVTNAALLIGLIQYMAKKNKPTWQPTPRG